MTLIATETPTPESALLRAVIYARVSSDPRQQLRSVSQQVDESKAECARRGWPVVRIFIDNDRSASRYASKERPEYAKLLAFLPTGQADVLVTWESSRAQRDLEVYVRLRGIAEESGVQWCYKGRLYDLSRTDDRFTTGLDALLDERESSVTRDRILRDVRSNAAKGRPHGRVPFGYRREYDPRTGALMDQVPDDALRETVLSDGSSFWWSPVEVIQEVSRRYASGEGILAISQDLNRRGIPSARGATWWPVTVTKLATRYTNIGKRAHYAHVINDGGWPAIVDVATFYACLRRATDPSRRRNQDGKAKHLLCGIMTCSRCGSPMEFHRSTDGVERYRCKGNGIARACTAIVEGPTDALVVGQIIERLSRPDAFDVFADDGDLAQEAAAVLAVAEEKRAILEQTADKAAAGEISVSMAARIEANLLPMIEAAEERANELRLGPVLRDVIRPDIAEVWPKLALAQRREVVRTLMGIELQPGTPGSHRFEPERVRRTWKHDL